ncbi:MULTISPECIES: DMT family transporter [unclassified Microbacterium]|uniref:EamA family transporter n=1 Tax=unclassified Microbacterium TaxID=2609290 RepID=UPI00214C0A0E|nr:MULTISPECIES: DMT family transporter [unclassified Microbacterium]MCR2809876.1 DMT family transporter [Microbacterium sp. zg.B185]WIM17815.1 DMT family transporter [Microbacterium sp. zg-B185]
MAAHTAAVPLLSPTASRAGASGLLLAVVSALAFSSSGPFIKPLLEEGWSLGAALLVRMGIAGLILSPALVLAVRRQPRFLRRHGKLILGFGLMPVLGCQLFFFSAMQRMPVAVALLIQYLAPVLLVAFVWMRTRRAPSALVLWGSAVAIVGLVLVVDVGGARFDLLGTLFALAAAVCVCAYFVISARAGEDLPPLALAAGGLLTGGVIMAVLCVTGIMPFTAPAVSVVLAGLEVPWFVPLLWVAALATTLGYALGVIAVPRIGSRVASFVGLSEVLFALGFAWLFLAEVPAPIQFAGGAAILVGVVLVRLDAHPRGSRRGAATLPAVPAP